MIEEWHLRVWGDALFCHSVQPNTRSRSRASSASSDDGYLSISWL
jgi:hypothetical protein